MEFFPNWSFIISKKMSAYPQFSLTPRARKNIPVLVGTTHKKPEYLEMRITYAQ